MPLCDCMSSKKAKYQFSCRVVHVHDYCVCDHVRSLSTAVHLARLPLPRGRAPLLCALVPNFTSCVIRRDRLNGSQFRSQSARVSSLGYRSSRTAAIRSVRFHETVQNVPQQRCRYVSVQGPAEGAGTCRHARNRAASKSGSLLDCAHHGAPFCVCGSTGLSHVDTSSPGDTPGANLFQSLRCP